MKKRKFLNLLLGVVCVLFTACTNLTNNSTEDIKYNLSINECSKSSNSLDDITRNFKCIKMATSLVKAQLEQGNSANALKISHEFYNLFPFDGRIRDAYKISLQVFKNTTNDILKEENPDCSIVLSRLLLLKKVAPDSVVVTKKCNMDLIRGKQLDPKISIMKFSNIQSVQYDKRSFRDLRSQLLYKGAKDLEDDYNALVLAGLKFWSSLSINARDIQFSERRGESVHLNFKGQTTLNHYDSCGDYRQFSIENGIEVTCRTIKGTTLGVERIKLGSTNARTLRKFIHSIPQMLIFSVNLKGQGGVKKYYYAVDNVKLAFGDNVSSSYKLSFKNSIINKFKAKQPDLYLPEWTSNGVSKYYEKHYGQNLTFGLNLNESDLAGVTEIFIDFEGYKTYQAYVLNQDPVHDWRKVIDPL